MLANVGTGMQRGAIRGQCFGSRSLRRTSGAYPKMNLASASSKSERRSDFRSRLPMKRSARFGRPSLAQQNGAVTRPALQWQQQVSKPWAPLQQQLVGWEADDTAAGGADNNKAKCLSYSSHIHDDKDPPTNVQKGMCMNVHRCTETPTKENGHYQGE